MSALSDTEVERRSANAGASRPTDHDHGDGSRPCRCGHGRDAHEHYRPGTECALCAPGDCTKYRPTRA